MAQDQPKTAAAAKNTNSGIQPTFSFLLGAAVAIMLIFYISSAMSDNGEIHQLQIPTLHSKYNNNQTTHDDELVHESMPITSVEKSFDEPFPGLTEILRPAAMDGDTVIMTWINEAWAAPNSLLDIFYESFHLGENIEYLLKHLVIVCVDEKAYDLCKAKHPHCYFLKFEGLDLKNEKMFMSKEYLTMMWRRNRLQQRVLELGYNFLFTDVDILWFRNPFRQISLYAHITLSSDAYYGDPDDLANFPNGGFLYVKSCPRTIEFYKNWYIARENWPGAHEQWVFNEIKREFSAKYRVKIQFIDTAVCAGFCNLTRDLSKITTLHANCCVSIGFKLHDLRILLDDWKNYSALPVKEKKKGHFNWSLPGLCVH